jgi:ATP-dependent helicase/nuclease subunit A
MVKIKEQDDIVELRENNIIVSASAGSGKTTVMIRRIVDLIINDNIKVDELLVLTYTRAAAGEMKQRLVAKMSENVENKPELAEQIENINNADI